MAAEEPGRERPHLPMRPDRDCLLYTSTGCGEGNPGSVSSVRGAGRDGMGTGAEAGDFILWGGLRQVPYVWRRSSDGNGSLCLFLGGGDCSDEEAGKADCRALPAVQYQQLRRDCPCKTLSGGGHPDGAWKRYGRQQYTFSAACDYRCHPCVEGTVGIYGTGKRRCV